MLSSELKMYMLVLAKLISGYMVKKTYIDTSIEKAGIPGFSGCIEHTRVISQLIKEANTTPWPKGEKVIETGCTISPSYLLWVGYIVTIAAKRN